jgi:hypothetical protein
LTAADPQAAEASPPPAPRNAMSRAAVRFGIVGGLVVPIAFTLLGWGARRFVSAGSTAAQLPPWVDVQLLLWPMSKLILDDPSGRHWLYLPLAALLSNALIYAAVGALSALGRKNRGVFIALVAAVALMVVAARQGFGADWTGAAIAMALSGIGLAFHHRAA